MAMSVKAWCRRLAEQAPGWHFWWQSGGGGTGWYAVPAPADMTHTQIIEGRLPGRLGPYRRAQELRGAALVRYGWDDYCATCGILARVCGHRSPETPSRP
jgi:hypothetical protein